MTMKDKVKFKKIFQVEVHDDSNNIDPENELEWYSLTVGWAIGKGIKPKDAHGFASYIRYKTNLG